MTLFERRKRLVAHELVDFSGLLADYSDPFAVGVSTDGSIFAAAGKAAEPLTEARGLGVFPKSRLARSTTYVVVHWKGSEQRRAVVADEEVIAAYVQPTPRGFLLVGARCHFRPEGAEKNAVEYDWDGRELRRLTLGDGIQDLRTTPNGSIWASYFDEGIFGNYGWSSPGPEGIGSSGCVCFDAEGTSSFRFSAEDAGTDDICDAYAMNVVDDDDVWLYFYTEFPIVHVSRDSYRVWECGVGGASGLAVNESRVLLFGDYEQRNLARTIRLDEQGTARVETETPLVDASGRAIDDAHAFGVGKDLYVLRGPELLLVQDW